MRMLTGRNLSGGTSKLREIDVSKGAARQLAASRSRLRLYAAKAAVRTDKQRTPSRGDE